jgi:hypothetical protein
MSKSLFLLFPLVCLLAVLVSCQPSKESIPADLKTGDQIVAALGKYKSQTGSYPDVLSALEPDYLRQIIPPRYGEKRWDYIHYCKKDSFALFMWGRKAYQDGYWYDSDKKQWGVVENSF